MAIGTNNGGAPMKVITNCWYLDGSAPGGGYYSSNKAENGGAMTSDAMKADAFVTTLGDAFAKDSDNINNGYPILRWQGGQQTEPEKADKSKLTEAVAAAQEASEGVEAAQDSKALKPGTVWVPQAKADDLQKAVESAQQVLADENATQAEVDAAAKAVNDAAAAYNSAKATVGSADFDALTKAIQAAQEDQDSAVVSADGSDVATTDQWVPQSAADALTEAVGAAQAVMENKEAAQEQVDQAVTTLNNAVKAFEAARKPGTKSHDASCPSKAFSDLDTSKWYHEAIDYVLLKNYFNGVGDGKFAPDGTMTRAMFVTVLGRAAGVEEDRNAHSSFGDVADGKWYTTYVDWAAQNDIVDGYDSKTFGPDDFITREQMAVILYRYARYKGVDVKAADDAKYHTFRDADQVSNYAKVPMIWAVDKGIINGMGDGTLAPQKTATRAQVAQLLMNFDQKLA